MECELQLGLTGKVLKKVLPPRVSASKDARVTLNTAASMFTLFLSSIAQDHTMTSKRQTILLKDVLQALRDMDMEHLIEPIEECLRETKVTAARKKATSGTNATAAAATTATATGDAIDDNADDDAMVSVDEDENDELDASVDDEENETADDDASIEQEDES